MHSSGRRLSSVDALRGLAVVLMFLHHFPLYLMRDYQSSEAYAALFGISRFSAPLFLFIVGASMALSAEKRNKAEGKNAAARHLVARGLVLFAAGFLLDLLAYKPLSDQNILHTIGLSMILFSPLAIDPKPEKGLLWLIFFGLASMLLPGMPIVEAVQGFFGFPLLPWASYVLFGIAAGYFMKKPMRMPKIFEAAALFFTASAFILTLGGIRFDFDSYATAPFIALSMGLLLYLCALFFWVYEVYGRDPLILRPFMVYGRSAFLLYVTHHIFIATIPGLFGLMNKLTLPETLSALSLFLAASFLFLRAWRRG